MAGTKVSWFTSNRSNPYEVRGMAGGEAVKGTH